MTMTRPSVELDHLFLFVPNEASAHEMMAAANLRVNYSRFHKGQGTRNLCACLDDVFLELLWLDGSEISAEAEAITLGARGRGQGSPVGVSWRGESEVACVAYAAPFLPAGVTIPVAHASLDLNLPFVFRTPGGTKPIDRKDGLVGDRQSPELTVLGQCEIFVPNPEQVSGLLAVFDRVIVRQGVPSLKITLLDSNGRIGREFTWTSRFAN
jgi:hypothetical protein